MAIDRLTQDYSPFGTQGRIRDPNIYVGVVKRNTDILRMGRLQVWIPEFGGDPTNENNWIICQYASPFGGATSPLSNRQDQSFAGTQRSYGFWGTPPDLENQVLVCFVNGDVSRAVWFACLWQEAMNHMIPGIASNTPTDQSQVSSQGVLPPVAEYNKLTASDPDSAPRPAYTKLATGLTTQGLQSDLERGVSSSSARRESPSQVVGLLSPGGLSLVLDDNQQNQFIRLRTPSGAQIVIHETTGYIYLISKNGNAWLELSDAGLDQFSANGWSVRAKGDVNIRADGDLILDAGGNIYLQAGKAIGMSAGADFNIGAKGKLVQSASGDISVDSSGNLLLKAQSAIRLNSGGDTSQKAGGNQVRDGASILDNTGAAPSVPDQFAQMPKPRQAPDVGSGGTPTTLSTITTRTPSREPWVIHPSSNKPPGSPQQSGSGSTVAATGSVPPSTVQQQCPTGVANTKMSNGQYNALVEASSISGVPQPSLFAVAQIESNNWNYSNTPLSGHSATGMMQVMPATWSQQVGAQNASQWGIGQGDIGNDRANAIVGANYLAQQYNALPSGQQTWGNAYARYNLGPGGGDKLIAAAANNPNGPVAATIGQNIANANPSLYTNNGQPLTNAQALQRVNDLVNGKAQAWASQLGLPGPCSRTETASAGSTASQVSGVHRLRGELVVARTSDASSGPAAYTTSGAPGVSFAMVSNAPRGYRNNNPLDLAYQPGLAGLDPNQLSDGRFAVFRTMQDGIAAALLQLITYQHTGRRTLTALLSEWSIPSGVATTDAFIQQLAQTMGVGATRPLDLTVPATATALVGAMSRALTGRILAADIIAAGVSQALAPYYPASGAP